MSDAPKPSGVIYFRAALTVYAVVLGFFLGRASERHYHQPHYNTRPPVELSAAERKAYPLRAKLPPMDVLLHIEDARTYAASSQVIPVSADAKKRGLSVLGWSAEPNATHMCEVHIPAGYPILADSKGYGAAIFASEQNAQTIAHELLHCARGDWHGKD